MRYFDCVDALQFAGPTIRGGCTEVWDFGTIQEAIDFAMYHYGIAEFADYDFITEKYKKRYWNE